MGRLENRLRRLEASRIIHCVTCEQRPLEVVWGPASGMRSGKDLEEALAEEERERREGPRRCPECGAELMVIEVDWE
jgi:hypothetical protein